jgi:thiosulfate/3-mercaptopyruvate sulfurtransferase
MSNPIIESSELFNIIDDPNLVILDCSPDSNKSGLEPFATDRYIPGARRLDMSKFSDATSPYPNTLCSANQFEEEAQNLGIMASSKIVVYDNLGVYMSPRVRWMFKTMGHDDVLILNGGLQAWMESDYPTSIETVGAFAKGSFKSSFDSSGFCNAGDVLQHLDDSAYKILDARSEKRFTGSVEEPRAGMRSGHIPGSSSLPFRSVISNGKFLPKQELARLFQDLNIEHESLIFTCGSGITACIIMTAAEISLDNHMAVFDGSWSEWAMREELPIERDE